MKHLSRKLPVQASACISVYPPIVESVNDSG